MSVWPSPWFVGCLDIENGGKGLWSLGSCADSGSGGGDTLFAIPANDCFAISLSVRCRSRRRRWRKRSFSRRQSYPVKGIASWLNLVEFLLVLLVESGSDTMAEEEDNRTPTMRQTLADTPSACDGRAAAYRVPKDMHSGHRGPISKDCHNGDSSLLQRADSASLFI
jgi:hypothetical protein